MPSTPASRPRSRPGWPRARSPGPAPAGSPWCARPAGGRPALADFFVAEPGLGRPHDRGVEMQAVDIGFGGGGETTQVFRIGGPRVRCRAQGRASRPCIAPTDDFPGR